MSYIIKMALDIKAGSDVLSHRGLLRHRDRCKGHEA